MSDTVWAADCAPSATVPATVAAPSETAPAASEAVLVTVSTAVSAASPAVRAAVCTPSRAVSAAVPAADVTASVAVDAPLRSRLVPRLTVAAKTPNGSSATLRVAPTSACTGVAWMRRRAGAADLGQARLEPLDRGGVRDVEALEDGDELVVAEALGERAGVAGALAQLVLEREVAEQRALQRLHLVDLRLQERAGLAQRGADDVGHAAGLADGVLQQLAALDRLGVVGAQLLGDRRRRGLAAADGGDGLLERREAEQVLQLADEHVGGDGGAGAGLRLGHDGLLRCSGCGGPDCLQEFPPGCGATGT